MRKRFPWTREGLGPVTREKEQRFRAPWHIARNRISFLRAASHDLFVEAMAAEEKRERKQGTRKLALRRSGEIDKVGYPRKARARIPLGFFTAVPGPTKWRGWLEKEEECMLVQQVRVQM